MSHLEFRLWKLIASALPKKLLYFSVLRAGIIASGTVDINPSMTIDQTLKSLGLE